MIYIFYSRYLTSIQYPVFFISATQKVVQIPAETREVQITSTTSKTTHITKTEVAPVFIQPLQPEVRAEANSVARSVKKG